MGLRIRVFGKSERLSNRNKAQASHYTRKFIRSLPFSEQWEAVHAHYRIRTPTEPLTRLSTLCANVTQCTSMLSHADQSRSGTENQWIYCKPHIQSTVNHNPAKYPKPKLQVSLNPIDTTPYNHSIQKTLEYPGAGSQVKQSYVP